MLSSLNKDVIIIIIDVEKRKAFKIDFCLSKHKSYLCFSFMFLLSCDPLFNL